MWKQLFGCVSPQGARSRLSVLVFHRVLPEPDPLFPGEMHTSRFNAVCGWLQSWFNVLPLDEAVIRMANGSLPARSACITFDDGYADNYQVALPILQRHGLTATFFIATGFLDGGCMWNDAVIESVRRSKQVVLDLSDLNLGQHPIGAWNEKQAAIGSLLSQIKYRSVNERQRLATCIGARAQVRPPLDLMLTSVEVRGMQQSGMQIGAHTVSHPILARLASEEAWQEIQVSKMTLEEILNQPVRLMAYPNGKPGEDFTLHHVEMVRSLGFDAAVSTQWGTSGIGDDLFQIRRFTPWDRTKMGFAARLLANYREGHSA
jgi:peptidoglycan/xylan/chitin deacetylase (PgdA/CDA1 family)